MRNSKISLRFREANPVGKEFIVNPYPHLPDAGLTVLVLELLRQYASADDDMYLCRIKETQRTFDARAFWLRHTCTEVEAVAA